MKFKVEITKEFDVSREAINKYMIGKDWILINNVLKRDYVDEEYIKSVIEKHKINWKS